MIRMPNIQIYKYTNIELGINTTRMPVGSLRRMSSRSVSKQIFWNQPKNDCHHQRHNDDHCYNNDHHDCQNFLRDLLKEARKSQEVSEDKLIEYTDTMVRSWWPWWWWSWGRFSWWLWWWWWNWWNLNDRDDWLTQGTDTWIWCDDYF